MIPNLEQHQKQWYEENAPLGKDLGYPECCINEFCSQPPVCFKYVKASDNDRRRYKAACIDGKFTGFIPCTSHAMQILRGQITLASLIENRNPLLPPFPFFANDRY